MKTFNSWMVDDEELIAVGECAKLNSALETKRKDKKEE
jgi:hypothetical protein